VKNVRPGILVTGAFFSAVITFLVFFTARNNQFVALDDFAYIVNNIHIETFGWDTVTWSLTSFYEGNWHPLTMLSLALDRYMWGLNPLGYHVTNIAIHSCTVFCSCFLFSLVIRAASPFKYVSGAGSCSADTPSGSSTGLSDRGVVVGSIAGALFFGLHPLRVESVVWASERKDVLCMFFMTTSLWMYFSYAIKRMCMPDVLFWQHREFQYALMLAALAQMSKPTAASLPLILLIADWYPLMRTVDKSSFLRSLVEKIPFFILSAIGVVLTLFAQQIAMKYAPDVGMISRLLVACKALLFYIAVTIWPFGLTAFYMHPGEVASSALLEYILYAVLVLSISLAVVPAGRRHRQWPAFWSYYVITLAPMLGLIQVGGQWVADRYSYLPSLGISLLWGGWVACISDRIQLGGRTFAARFCLVFAACQLLFYSVLTLRQIPVWRTTETLATRIIDRSPHMSGAPYLARATYRNETGRYELALEDIGEAMKIALRRGLTRTYPEIAIEQAVILKNLGRFSEALTMVEWGIQTSVGPPPPDAVNLRNELARLAVGSHSGR
jgi:protein O-mannosyl-transferase